QVQALLHAFLVSSKERFRLRIFVLSRAFTLVTRWLFFWTQRIHAHKTLDDKPWNEVWALHHDFRKLSDESIESLRVLLLSVAPLPPGTTGLPPAP
ncbi:MAG TPA: hypothetical protein VN083_05360, partial [Vicinamibacteria bacterium]|nr:hypothetical protein [Vicinamibacteria bacterium]